MSHPEMFSKCKWTGFQSESQWSLNPSPILLLMVVESSVSGDSILFAPSFRPKWVRLSYSNPFGRFTPMTMRKKWLLALGLLLIAAASGLASLQFSKRQATDSALDEIGPTLTYETHVLVRQHVEGQDESTLIDIRGQLDQAWDRGTDFLSRWAGVQEFILLNKAQDLATRESLVNRSIHSHYMSADNAFAHDFQGDFPKEFLPFHAGLLHRILLPKSLEDLKRDGSKTTRERDEVGEYQAQYSASGNEVTKRWLHYSQDFIKVDRSQNRFVYSFGKDHRIDSVQGELTLYYRQSTPTRFQIVVDMKRIGPSHSPVAQVDNRKAVRYSEADIAKSGNGGPRALMSFDEAFSRVDGIAEESESAEVFRIFTSLRSALDIDPRRAKEVIAKIEAIKGRDPASRRRLSVLFGALAQAKDPAISDLLADQAASCPDNYCKIQAIAGVNSHPYPTAEALGKMLALSESSTDVEIAGNALLAAGSAGSHMDDPGHDLAETLMKMANDPEKIAIKTAAIAAMGNHGSAEYLPVLQKNLSDLSSSNRSAAAYSMRYIPDPAVDSLLIDVLSKEKDLTVLRDALKALDYRSLSQQDYAKVSQSALAISDTETQKIGARVLIQAYREDPALVENSLKAMAAKAGDSEVKDYIEAEMQKIKSDREAGETDSVKTGNAED
jgi:hypothetical protein